MPTYVYYYTDRPDSDERLEVWQSMKEDALTECPNTGRPIKRLMCNTMPFGGAENFLDEAKIAQSGMAKYVKTSEDTYELAAGGADSPKKIDAETIVRQAKAEGRI